MGLDRKQNGVTSGDSCGVAFSSCSEICLRVMKAGSTSVLLFCGRWLSSMTCLCSTDTKTHVGSHLSGMNLRKQCHSWRSGGYPTAWWAGATAWFWSRGWRSSSCRGCPAAPPSPEEEEAAADSAWGPTCPDPEAPSPAARQHRGAFKSLSTDVENYSFYFYVILVKRL